MLLIYLIYLCLLAAVHTFDLQKFCRKRCAIGQGGNLCRCTAHHFAGKRSDTHAAAEAAAAAAAENLDAEGQARLSRESTNDILNNNNNNNNNNEETEVGPEDLQILSMNDELLSNSRVFYPMMGLVPNAGSRRATLMGRLPAEEDNMGLLRGESVPDDSSSSDTADSRSTLNILAKRYRRYNQKFTGGVPPSYKRISASNSADNTARLKVALEKALDNNFLALE